MMFNLSSSFSRTQHASYYSSLQLITNPSKQELTSRMRSQIQH